MYDHLAYRLIKDDYNSDHLVALFDIFGCCKWLQYRSRTTRAGLPCRFINFTIQQICVSEFSIQVLSVILNQLGLHNPMTRAIPGYLGGLFLELCNGEKRAHPYR
ncbi:hypothetical protein Leryth_020093 [Lithospermum erythrorhizon]|nr:hypothetical protein Leryth_020093 [Lithospermum erythrorhizon]